MPSHLSKIQEAMRHPEFYPHRTFRFQRHETHISVVFLSGDYVYKIKKAVDLGFLDFTTLEQRRDACEKEFDLNQRLSRDVYLDVVTITQDGGKYELDGKGTVVEYAVLMRRLPADRTFDRLLAAGEVGSRDLEELADVLDRFYRNAAIGERIDDCGGREVVRKNCEENFHQTVKFAGTYIDSRYFDIVQAGTRAFIDNASPLFEERIAQKQIRDCHGDLKCEHVYFTGRGIQIIDCIEYNERFRFGDTAEDLAFLLMDMDFLGHNEAARRLLDAYVKRSNDLRIYNMLAFYKCYRAMVKVKVNCFRLEQIDTDDRARDVIRENIRGYMKLAYRYALSFSRPEIWVVCGVIASGKSTIAGALAVVLDIPVLKTDSIRRDLFRDTTKSTGPAAFGEGAYSPEATALTYGQLFNRAEDTLKEGRSVILDATFSLEKQRNEIRRLAESHQVSLKFIVCECRESVIRQRLADREGRGGISNARLSHWEKFKRRVEDIEEIPDDQIFRIDTEQPVEENLKVVLNRYAYA